MKRAIAIITCTAMLFLLTGCFGREEPMVDSVPSDSAVTSEGEVSQSATSDGTDSSMSGDSSSMGDGTSSSADAADTDNHNVEIINETGTDIYGLQHSITGEDNYGDPLTDGALTNGGSANITVPRGEDGTMYNLRAYDNEEQSGDGWIFPDIDFTRDGRIILRYKEDAPDYVYGDEYDSESGSDSMSSSDESASDSSMVEE